MSGTLILLLVLFIFGKAIWPRHDPHPIFVRRFIAYVLAHGNPIPPWLVM